MLSRAIVAVMIIVAMVGCAGPIQTVTQQVPVPVPCNPPEIQTPVLPIDALPSDANLFEITRALWASLEIWTGHIAELKVALDACR